MKRLIAFDLDGTLAASKQPIRPDMAALLISLLSVAVVAVISGGDWPQFETQVADQLHSSDDLRNLFIMPTTGTKLYRFDGAWHLVYAQFLKPEERKRILKAVDHAVAEAGLKHERIWGEQIEDRGSQITFSGLGQKAPLDAKQAWDPDFAKRKALQTLLRHALPNLSVNVGGSTSIDITQKDVDKAYAMRRLAESSGIATSDMLFIGDAIYPGGNDDPVRVAGIDIVAVRDVAETMSVIKAILACLKP
ncbi:HAD-IIB family hydrolase [Polymorphobacter megasporae]|uniref:HAD-IIB family hydrolase n=1 Tax=Glacieibacterium megasporae TaxID=2835787 RepID=UPI001C1E2F4B|nr:HAD-IIB family hydrolase [Polymorphobacter megasporae]UAJ10537.1 HAD-IIB family hydrolase [Polymorphobacter megasporae]